MIKLDKPLLVSNPLLPSLTDLNSHLEEIWQSKWLTNMGSKHKQLEERLKEELKVKNLSLFNNGTIALLTALKTMRLPIGSEVITTPFTFAATPHCISWNNLKPVFCDIEPETMTIDVNKIEELITPNTTAILGVHVYGFPCDVEKINYIARNYRLRVIYDAAHAFSTEISGKSIGTFGDITMYSFHATKLYNTAEGGCLTYNDDSLADEIYNLRNFGIRSQEEIVDIGINGKMNEIQAAIGLLNLEIYREEQSKRSRIRKIYYDELSQIKGIRIPQRPPEVSDSGQYFPILVEKEYGLSRDLLFNKLRECNIFTRKYFYPLCSDYKPYRYFISSKPKNLPVANEIAGKVLCLPFYGSMLEAEIDAVCTNIKALGK